MTDMNFCKLFLIQIPLLKALRYLLIGCFAFFGALSGGDILFLTGIIGSCTSLLDELEEARVEKDDDEDVDGALFLLLKYPCSSSL